MIDEIYHWQIAKPLKLKNLHSQNQLTAERLKLSPISLNPFPNFILSTKQKLNKWNSSKLITN